MTLEPIIKSRLDAFKNDYDLSGMKDSDVFEMLVNKEIIISHQPNALDTSLEMLNNASVGGSQDGGLDGVCIKVDEVFVSTLSEVEEILSKGKKVDIEFLFIQSKYKNSFATDDYLKFTSGVKDFLCDTQYLHFNEDVQFWIAIKNKIFDFISNWKSNPSIRLYYVVMGNWYDDKNIIAISNQFKNDIASFNTYGDISIHYISKQAFQKMYNENENTFNITLPYIANLKLDSTDDVDDFEICSFAANEFLKLLISEEGILRRNLFEDNVRDYQGNTNVNNGMLNTIKENPELFALYNNGITIVCRKLTDAKRSLTIESPQIVNGCQTCNALFIAKSKGYDLSQIVVNVKLISTQNDELINGVVEGNNKQNIVQEEAFETILPFHKELEKFFIVQAELHSQFQLFYERRSKQLVRVEQFKKINFSNMIRSFVSVFLEEPHSSVKHQFTLTNDYKTKIFKEGQSYLPYYTAARLYAFIDQLTVTKVIDKNMKSLKMHTAFTFALMYVGRPCDINCENDIDKYCDRLLEAIFSPDRNQKICDASYKLQTIVDKWIREKGINYRYAINDRSDFTNYIISNICGNDSSTSKTRSRGVVEKTGFDKYKLRYGQISSDDKSIFFHESDNANINFSSLKGKNVLFDIKNDSKLSEGVRAINVTILE